MKWVFYVASFAGWLSVQTMFLAISTRMLWAWWMTWLPSIILGICLLLIALTLTAWARSFPTPED